MQDTQQPYHRPLLSHGHRVAGEPVLVQSALVADTYAALIIISTVRSSLQRHPVLRLCAIPSHVEVIPHIPQVHRPVVPLEHLRRIVLVAPRTRAMQHQVLHVFDRHQINSSHNRQ